MIELATEDPDSVTHDEFLLLQSAIGYQQALKILTKGRQVRRSKSLQHPSPGETKQKLMQKKESNTSNKGVPKKIKEDLEKKADIKRRQELKASLQKNILQILHSQNSNPIKRSYSIDNPLGKLADKLKLKVGEEANISCPIDLGACKISMKLSVGELTSVSAEKGPFTISWQDNALKAKIDILNINIGEANITESFSAKWLETTLSKSFSAYGYTYSLSDTRSLKNTKFEYSVSTNPKNDEPKVSLKVSIEYDNIKTALVAVVVIIALIAPEALAAAVPVLNELVPVFAK